MSLTRELGSFKKYIVGFMALWIVVACGAGTGYASIEPATRQTLALEHATIVDVRSGKLTRDQTIIIKDNKISYIGSSSQTAIWKTSIQAGIPAPRLVYAGSTSNMSNHLHESLRPQ